MPLRRTLARVTAKRNRRALRPATNRDSSCNHFRDLLQTGKLQMAVVAGREPFTTGRTPAAATVTTVLTQRVREKPHPVGEHRTPNIELLNRRAAAPLSF